MGDDNSSESSQKKTLNVDTCEDIFDVDSSDDDDDDDDNVRTTRARANKRRKTNNYDWRAKMREWNEGEANNRGHYHNFGFWKTISFHIGEGIARDMAEELIQKCEESDGDQADVVRLRDYLYDFCKNDEEEEELYALLPDNNEEEGAEEKVFADDLLNEMAKLRNCKRKGCCDYAEENEEMCAKHLKQQEKQRQRDQKRKRGECSVEGCVRT